MAIDLTSINRVTDGVKLSDITVAPDGSIKFGDPAVAKAIAELKAHPEELSRSLAKGVNVNVLLCNIRILTRKGCGSDDDAVVAPKLP